MPYPFMLKLLLITILVLNASQLTYAQDQPQTEESKQAKDLHIYLLIGQSNMAGRAPLNEESNQVLTGVFLYKSKGQWEAAKNPLNRYSNIHKGLQKQKLGPGYSFASKMMKAYPKQRIGLIVNARGGSNIDKWQKGQKYYNYTLGRAKGALKSGTLKGILWHQGESNHKDPDYVDKLTQLVTDLRKDLDAPDLPFIAGQIRPNQKTFNNNLLKLTKRLPHTAVVSSQGLTTFDRWHFDTDSSNTLGERYAEAMIQFLKHKKVE